MKGLILCLYFALLIFNLISVGNIVFYLSHISFYNLRVEE
jgi:hypothetical protein